MNFDGLNHKLLPNASSLLVDWLPGGKIAGSEYEAATLWGGKGKSVKVNIKTGKWAEFAGDEKGTDLVSLYAAIKGLSQRDAYIALGGESDSSPSLRHPVLGIPSAFWSYRSTSGTQTILIVARYEGKDGKTFLPWIPNGTGWKNAYPPPLRPLYGLDQLASRPSAQILIVEGEKTAEAAKILCPDFVVITWPSGAKAWSKADWTPLDGRSGIVLWPDADPTGISAMDGISKLLSAHCGWIKILDVSDKPLAWDAADGLTEGLTTAQVYDWIGETKELTPSFSFKSGFLSDLLSQPEPELSWLIESLWTDKSRGFVAGAPGIGKTWVTLEMLISVCTGQLCLGKFKPISASPVLLVEEESSIYNLARRAHALAKGRSLEPSSLRHFHHLTRQSIDILKQGKELTIFMKNNGIKFAVFDSLRRFHHGDENSSEKMKPVLEMFGRMGEDAGASILLIHHLSKRSDKPDKRPIFERMRGTSDLWAWRDCVMGLEGEPDGNVADCSFQFRDAESTPKFRIKRTMDKALGSMTLAVTSLEESDEFMEKAAKLLDYVRSNQPVGKDQACAKSGGRKIDNVLIFNTLVERQKLVQMGYKWGVPELVGTNRNDGNV